MVGNFNWSRTVFSNTEDNAYMKLVIDHENKNALSLIDDGNVAVNVETGEEYGTRDDKGRITKEASLLKQM